MEISNSLLVSSVATMLCLCVASSAQVSNVDGLQPLQGVTIPKIQTPKLSENFLGAVKFSWPTEGKIIGNFDSTRKGIDIAGQLGQPILSAGDGTVLYAKYMRGYGNLVILDHTDGLVTAYAHNKNILVKEGQIVTRGQNIAEMGNSEADSVKLHFELRQMGKPVDPLGMLPLKSEALSIVDIRPGATFKDCNDCPEMVVIPAGSFKMGHFGEIYNDVSGIPKHTVQIQSFAIGKYEVTQKEFEAVMETNPSLDAGRTLPVEHVSWNEAQEFVQRLSKKTGKNYRLPSEAEWEYAARGGSTTVYPWGNDESEMPNYAWFLLNSADSLHPVGLKKPNQFGLYDMLGNVWEWTQDCWNDNYKGAPTDGSAWISGDCRYRSVRGGSWSWFAHGMHSASRHRVTATKKKSSALGFRVAMSN